MGLTIAGLCVISGGLILIFVWFLTFGLTSTGNSNNQSSTSTSTSAQKATRIPMPSPSPTVPPVTPTSTYPGQQYIDSPQMSSAVEPNTARPLDSTTTFKIKQRMYVTFQVHTGGHSGAVCLMWFLNTKQITSYAFAVDATASLAYSYAAAYNAGAGRVDIYWATIPSCADPNKILAQSVNFTVSA